jgi:hypothetical protein
VASQQGEPPSRGINWQAVSAIAAVVLAIAAILTLALKPFSSGKPRSPTGPTAPKTGTKVPTETTPIATGPTEVCQKEVTLEEDASYNLNECKANREEPVGIFEVRERPSNSSPPRK